MICLPTSLPQADAHCWDERQHKMEDWYRNLFADDEEARSCFTHDYRPYAPLLTTFSGKILDLGGGAGITRNFLPLEARYVIVEPSLSWLRSEWKQVLGLNSDLLLDPAYFVRAVGEYLALLGPDI